MTLREGGSGFVDGLCAALLKNAENVVIQDHSGAHTGAQFMRKISWAGMWLQQLGAESGTVVAVTSANTTWGLALRYGAHMLGAVACHLPFIGAQRQAALVAVVNPSFIVTDGTGPMAALDICPIQRPELPSALPPAAARSFAPIHRYRSEDVCVLTPSGGTTGVPKASYRTYDNYSLALRLPADPNRRQLVVTPFAYIASSLIDQTLIGRGAVILGENSWTIRQVVDTAGAEKPTHMFLVEPALADLVAAAESAPEVGRKLASLKQITHLGAAAPMGLRERARALFGDSVAHGYAASELGHVSSTLGHPFNPHTAGFLLPGVACRILDGEGATVPAGQPGTIALKSKRKANGYWNGAPGQEFDEWIHTTDEGTLSADGELTVRGRSGGYLGASGIHASDIEALVSTIDGVEYVIALNNPNERDAASIIVQSSNPQIQLTIRDNIVSLFQDRLKLKTIVVKQIPRTEQGKPDRLAIDNRLANR